MHDRIKPSLRIPKYEISFEKYQHTKAGNRHFPPVLYTHFQKNSFNLIHHTEVHEQSKICMHNTICTIQYMCNILYCRYGILYNIYNIPYLQCIIKKTFGTGRCCFNLVLIISMNSFSGYLNFHYLLVFFISTAAWHQFMWQEWDQERNLI